MKTKRNKWSAPLLVALLSCSILFTGCSKDEADTSVKLNSFGPSPALRGGELRFIGNNLNQVTAIVFQGLTSGTTVEVTAIIPVNEREIKAVIPQDAGPGIITLKTVQGDIRTLTPVTFSEPIEIAEIVPASLKAGQTLTIKGDYLNLVTQVIFFDGVAVEQENFVAQSRQQIQVVVPVEAQSGKIRVSNGAEIPIEVYFDEELQITLPSVTTVSPTTVKPGNSITITGKDLDLVSVVKFGGDKEVSEFAVNEDFTQITVTAPAEMQDGEIMLIAKSGVEVTASQSLTTVMPSGLAVSPATVKNGASLTITGQNLDLVSEAKLGEIDAEITSQSATEIVITVPEKATDTSVTLVTLSTKSVKTPQFSYIKPVIASLSPASLMAGTDVTVGGTNLDLIRSVVFPSAAAAAEVEPASPVSFTVTVPTDAVSGNVTFVTVNGTEIVSPMSLTVTAADIPVITSIPANAKPEQLLVIEGTKLNLVESVIFQNNIKATRFGTRSATLLEVYVPDNVARGNNTLRLVTFDNKTVEATVNIMATDPIIATTVMLTNFNGGGNSQSTWGTPFSFGVPGIPLDGSQCMIGKSSVSGWTWSWAANWGSLPALGNPNNYVFKMDICITKPVPSGISAGMAFRGLDNSINLGNIFANSTEGNWITLTFNLNPDNAINGSGDYGFYINATQTVDLSGVYIDNFRFDLK